MTKIILLFALLGACAAVSWSEPAPQVVVPNTSGHGVATSVANVARPPVRSIAVSRYTDFKKRFVTLKPNVRVTKWQLMKGLKKNSLLIIVCNKSEQVSHEEIQLYIHRADFGSGDHYNSYFGRGPLLPGEMRIFKIHDKTPASVTLYSYSHGAGGFVWRNKTPIQSGRPLVITLLSNNKIHVARNLRGIVSR